MGVRVETQFSHADCVFTVHQFKSQNMLKSITTLIPKLDRPFRQYRKPPGKVATEVGMRGVWELEFKLRFHKPTAYLMCPSLGSQNLLKSIHTSDPKLRRAFKQYHQPPGKVATELGMRRVWELEFKLRFQTPTAYLRCTSLSLRTCSNPSLL